jgi:hypothetical protein
MKMTLNCKLNNNMNNLVKNIIKFTSTKLNYKKIQFIKDNLYYSLLYFI